MIFDQEMKIVTRCYIVFSFVYFELLVNYFELSVNYKFSTVVQELYLHFALLDNYFQGDMPKT